MPSSSESNGLSITESGPPIGLTVLATVLAIAAFTSNSILARLALGAEHIDAASFTTVRTLAAAATLWAILQLRQQPQVHQSVQPRMVTALLVYLVAFSFAYISLNAGTGALILFGAVQLTMFAVAFAEGERFSVSASAGIVLALGGLVYLLTPGTTVPDAGGALLMAIAGVAWGAYSLLGRGTMNPIAVTASNFLCCCPLVIVIGAVFASDTKIDAWGTILAILSGSLASGCGYAIWYTAVRGMTAGRAAVVQLSVPAFVALASAIVLLEPITTRLVIASSITLGGVALVLSQRSQGR